jgi:hypothetical protein
VSVSKIRHDSFSISPLDAGTTNKSTPPRENFAIVPSTPDAGEFWTHFNQTLDEFFRTITASKEHIKRLSDNVAERDQRIELLTAENAALREQIEASEVSFRHVTGPKPASANEPPRDAPNSARHEPSPDGRPRRSIWSRLSGFDDPTPLEDREF